MGLWLPGLLTGFLWLQKAPEKCTLPNGTTVACLNPAEAAFLFQQMWVVGGEGEYLQHPIQFDTAQDALVLDVGANIGLLGVRLREHFASGGAQVTLHSWEPVPELQRCVVANGTENCHPYGLGAKPAARVEFTVLQRYSLLSGVGGHSLLSDESASAMAEYIVDVALAAKNDTHPIGRLAATDRAGAVQLALEEVVRPMLDTRSVTVEIRTLSGELDRLGLGSRRVALLKIDVEGAEWEVLQGIRADHWSKVDQVIVEVRCAAPCLCLPPALFTVGPGAPPRQPSGRRGTAASFGRLSHSGDAREWTSAVSSIHVVWADRASRGAHVI